MLEASWWEERNWDSTIVQQLSRGSLSVNILQHVLVISSTRSSDYSEEK